MANVPYVYRHSVCAVQVVLALGARAARGAAGSKRWRYALLAAGIREINMEKTKCPHCGMIYKPEPYEPPARSDMPTAKTWRPDFLKEHDKKPAAKPPVQKPPAAKPEKSAAPPAKLPPLPAPVQPPADDKPAPPPVSKPAAKKKSQSKKKRGK